MQLRMQVLPAPLGPIIASISLSLISTLISTSARTPPKDRERCSILILTLFDVVTFSNQDGRIFTPRSLAGCHGIGLMWYSPLRGTHDFSCWPDDLFFPTRHASGCRYTSRSRRRIPAALPHR